MLEERLSWSRCDLDATSLFFPPVQQCQFISLPLFIHHPSSLPLSIFPSLHPSILPFFPPFRPFLLSSLPPSIPSSNFRFPITFFYRRMDIPEIRLAVAAHLRLSDVCACALVCREWNDTITPILYSHFHTRSSQSVAIERLCVHARTVRLSMDDPNVKVLQEGPATQVRELGISGGGDVYESVPVSWICLLQQNPHLVKLACDKMLYSTLEDIVSLCPNLQELVVDHHQFRRDPPASNTGNNWLSFWRICQGLTRLELLGSSVPVSLRQPSEFGDEILPAMRHLSILNAQCSIKRQLRLISACPNLEFLKWSFDIASDEDANMELEPLLAVFRSFHGLPELHVFMPYITLGRHSLGQDWTRTLMQVIPPLTLTRFYDSQDRVLDNKEGLVEGPLSRHFRTLVELDIRGWKEVTSKDNHLILTSCPGLQKFESREYQIGQIPTLSGDILTTSNSGLGPLGWVCSRLLKIRLEFLHETPEKSRMMFDQLCCMKNIEFVNLRRAGSGLYPMYIRWDDEISAKHWHMGVTDFTDVSLYKKEMLKIWPMLKSFNTYSE